MASVLQSVKQKQLSDLEAKESSMAFQIVTGCVDGGEMSAKQLKKCLRALGFSVTAAEALAFVYEFDYNSTDTIGFADFQRVYLFKTLQRSKHDLYDEAFDALQGAATGVVKLRDLDRNALSATVRTKESPSSSERGSKSTIDTDTFVRCVELQHYGETEDAAIASFLASARDSQAPECSISRDALGAFLRV